MLKMMLFIAVLVSTVVIAETKDRSTEQTFDRSKEVDVSGHGDYSHDRGDRGQSNFRLRDGETHTIHVEPGDRLIREEGTLSQ